MKHVSSTKQDSVSTVLEGGSLLDTDVVGGSRIVGIAHDRNYIY